MTTPPDPATVAKLTAMHIEDPEIVAAILEKHGMTLCEIDPEHDEPTD